VLALDPTNHIAWTNRGWAQSHDPVAAIADYTGAIHANPRFYLAWFNRGNARHAQGDYQGAIADYTAAIALLPDDPKAWNNRGWSRQQLGDWQGAADDYARALVLAGPTWVHRPLVEQNLATARAQLGHGDATGP
jgi:tetratricopeptide (TPR) repeat protein